MTSIEWTHRPGTKGESWNPIVAWRWLEGKRLRGWHCEHASTGCINCYSERQNVAGAHGGTKLPYKPGHRPDIEIELHEPTLTKPLSWKSPRTVFICSMTDLFADFVTDDWIDRIFAVMALCPQHTFQVLTKRAERMRAYMQTPDRKRIIAERVLDISDLMAREAGTWKARPSLDHFSACFAGSGPFPNVWLGVSAERQEEADERIPLLLQTPAAIRFVSLEPLLGPIDLTNLGDVTFSLDAFTGEASHLLGMRDRTAGTLDWVITGGESGREARPANPQWFRDIEAQCRTAGAAYFHKQNGEWVSVSEVEGAGAHFHFPDGRTVRRVGKKAAGRLLDGREHNGMPEARA